MNKKMITTIVIVLVLGSAVVIGAYFLFPDKTLNARDAAGASRHETEQIQGITEAQAIAAAKETEEVQAFLALYPDENIRANYNAPNHQWDVSISDFDFTVTVDSLSKEVTDVSLYSAGVSGDSVLPYLKDIAYCQTDADCFSPQDMDGYACYSINTVHASWHRIDASALCRYADSPLSTCTGHVCKTLLPEIKDLVILFDKQTYSSNQAAEIAVRMSSSIGIKDAIIKISSKQENGVVVIDHATPVSLIPKGKYETTIDYRMPVCSKCAGIELGDHEVYITVENAEGAVLAQASTIIHIDK